MTTQDLTTGRPAAKLLVFSLPLIGGSLFQQLYNFIDTLIVGRLIGVDAVAAIGAYYPLSFLILGFIQGTCIGLSIPLSSSVGARNVVDQRRYLTNGIWIAVGLTAVLTPIMICTGPAMLRALSTPDDVIDLAIAFTVVSFIGIPANIAYNYTAAALRAFGDSVHPLYFLLASLVLNIALDLLFIEVLHWGIAGAAWATVISEFAAAVLNSVLLVGGKSRVVLRRADWALSRSHVRRMCVVALPMGFEYSVSAIGAIVLQDAINHLGSTVMAAQSTGEKIRQLFTLPMEAFGMAMATYQSQNHGARRSDRMKAGILDGCVIQVVYSVVSFLVLCVVRTPLSEAILGEGQPDVVALSSQYVAIISMFFPLHGLLMVMRNTLQGWGHSLYAFVSGLFELAGRSFGGLVLIAHFGYLGVCLSNPVAFAAALVYCTVMVWIVFRRENTGATFAA